MKDQRGVTVIEVLLIVHLLLTLAAIVAVTASRLHR